MKEQLKKGKKVYVEGRLKKGEYTDKEGVKRYTAEVISERIISLEGSGESSGNSDVSSEGSSQDGNISPVDSGEDLPF